MLVSRLSAAGAMVALMMSSSTILAQSQFGFGRPATEAEIAAWNLDIDRDGKALPPGRGSVAEGMEIYAEQCSSCHGEQGEGGIGDRLVGGQGTLDTPKPIRTVGSYWPYTSTLFDYIRRTMPLSAPQSLTNEQVYALSAYILNMNGIVPDDVVMDADALAAVVMPNRDGFVDDPGPDVP